MTTRLATLIQTTANERGWSMREVARRSGLPPATVHKVANPAASTIPHVDTIEAIADGLGIPAELLLDAAASDRGLKPTQRLNPDDPDTAIVIAGMAELSEERRSEVAALVRAMLSNRHATS